jgi:hypothetical protein
LISVPAPDNEAPWNAEMIKCPALAEFGVMAIAELNVPATSNAGLAGVITAEL